MTVYVLICS